MAAATGTEVAQAGKDACADLLTAITVARAAATTAYGESWEREHGAFWDTLATAITTTKAAYTALASQS